MSLWALTNGSEYGGERRIACSNFGLHSDIARNLEQMQINIAAQALKPVPVCIEELIAVAAPTNDMYACVSLSSLFDRCLFWID